MQGCFARRRFLTLFLFVSTFLLWGSVALHAQASGTLIVLNKAEASASLIDLASGEEILRLETGVGPHEVAVSPDGKTAVVFAEPACLQGD